MVWYAFGDRAPSAKVPNDLWLYELALDMKLTPDTIRKMNVRDRNHLILVNEGRKLATKQIAIANKIPGTYAIGL